MLTYLRPLRVAVLSSHRCPGAADLLADPALGRRWELACVFSSEADFETRPLFLDADVPFLSYPIRDFYRRRRAPLSDRAVRREYDAAVADLLRLWEPDLLLFSSYLYVATPVLLGAAPGGAINIHGSDMSLVGGDGRPKYPGLRAVADAILSGEPETRATAHWMTEEVDGGPVILRSRAYPVPPFVADLLADGNRRAVKAYACAHQEWMLADAWGILARQAIRFAFAGWRAPDLDLVPVAALEEARS